MNWRLLTAINAAIALITVGAVTFVVATRPRDEHARTKVQSNLKNEQNQRAEREAKARIEALDDLSQARVDDLGDTKTSLNYNARNNIAYNWGTLDPDAALEWVGKQKNKDYIDPSYMYNEVIRGWCFKDIGAASAYVAQHLDDPAADRAAASVAEAMFARDPGSATGWVSNMPNGPARSEAESTIARIWVEKDPSATAKWLAALPENEQSDLVGTIAKTWADNNWPEASRWIETLSGDVRDSAISNAMNREDATESDALTLALSSR